MSTHTSWIQATVLRCDGEGGTCTKEEQREALGKVGPATARQHDQIGLFA